MDLTWSTRAVGRQSFLFQGFMKAHTMRQHPFLHPVRFCIGATSVATYMLPDLVCLTDTDFADEMTRWRILADLDTLSGEAKRVSMPKILTNSTSLAPVSARSIPSGLNKPCALGAI